MMSDKDEITRGYTMAFQDEEGRENAVKRLNERIDADKRKMAEKNIYPWKETDHEENGETFDGLRYFSICRKIYYRRVTVHHFDKGELIGISKDGIMVKMSHGS